MPIKNVDAKTLKSWLDKGEAVLVDVREPAENKSECIREAELMPLGRICANNLPDHDGKKLVLHCRKGGRGGSACEKLLAENPGLEVYNLAGGMEAWKAQGYEIKASEKFFLPLDRQVQLAIGVCLLTASLLGYFISPVYFLVTGFFGIGLTIAGLTGFCGLAMIMAKMPWNQISGT